MIVRDYLNIGMQYIYKITMMVFASMLLIQNNVFALGNTHASTKPAKPRKPETEAETVLDRMLRMDADVNGELLKIEHRDMFTKEFNADWKRQEEEYSNGYICPEGYICATWVRSPVSCSYDSVYTYSSNPYDELFEGTSCTPAKKECYIDMLEGTYYMKKEDGKWKIDGTFCKPNTFNTAINVKKVKK